MSVQYLQLCGVCHFIKCACVYLLPIYYTRGTVYICMYVCMYLYSLSLYVPYGWMDDLTAVCMYVCM